MKEHFSPTQPEQIPTPELSEQGVNNFLTQVLSPMIKKAQERHKPLYKDLALEEIQRRRTRIMEVDRVLHDLMYRIETEADERLKTRLWPSMLAWKNIIEQSLDHTDSAETLELAAIKNRPQPIKKRLYEKPDPAPSSPQPSAPPSGGAKIIPFPKRRKK